MSSYAEARVTFERNVLENVNEDISLIKKKNNIIR